MSEEVELNEETGEVVGTLNEQRLARMSAISDQSEEERAEDLVNGGQDEEHTPFVPEGTTDAVVEDEVEVLPEPVAPVAKHKIKVNGVEKELSFDELIALAQKAEAADERFQEAARIREEAKKLAPPELPVKDVPVDDSEELAALARALQIGSQDEAVAALRKLKGSATPPPARVDELYQVIDAKLAFNEAIRTFRTEFSDLVSDPRLERMVMERDAELISTGDKRPYLDRYREVGNEVREWRNSLAPAPTPPAVTVKEARKATAPTTPTTASGKAAKLDSGEEAEESVQQTIEKMMVARGGTQRMR